MEHNAVDMPGFAPGSSMTCNRYLLRRDRPASALRAGNAAASITRAGSHPQQACEQGSDSLF
jgi:hypothetical protein